MEENIFTINNIDIGRKIKMLRIQHGISQHELARILNISNAHMSNIEGGRVSLSLKLLLRIREHMDFNINGLFEPGTEIYNITPKNPATHDILLMPQWLNQYFSNTQVD